MVLEIRQSRRAWDFWWLICPKQLQQAGGSEDQEVIPGGILWNFTPAAVMKGALIAISTVSYSTSTAWHKCFLSICHSKLSE